MNAKKRKRRLYRYVVDHDCGFAPNPFFGACTLACCKPKIRSTAQKGDVIVGFGCAKYGLSGRMIYWMEVGEILTFDQYWGDVRFQNKKPSMTGSVMMYFGDNIYSRDDEDGPWHQLRSFHSDERSMIGQGNLKRDTGSTRVLIGQDFTYWGSQAAELPARFASLAKKGRGHSVNVDDESLKDEFIVWLKANEDRGFLADPVDWARNSKLQTALSGAA